MQRNSKDSLGDRIKTNYEGPACHYLTRRLPVIVRLDGRAFHTFTANMVKPFDQHLIDAMIVAAYHVFGEMQGCKLAYIQSDEASFVMTDFDTLETEPWFGYRQSKVESVSASLMTAAFARAMRLAGVRELATFDARAFNIPEDEVANYFVWRAKDWARNSLSMYAQANFSHADLQGKKCKDMHNMLHDLGKNWTLDLSDAERNGTFIYNGDRLTDTSDIVPTFKSISALWQKVKPKETSEETP